jgi:hypothetical protein
MPPRTSFVAEVATTQWFELAAAYGRSRHPKAILIDLSRKWSATCGRPRHRNRCLKSPARVLSISAAGPSKTALLYQSRNGAIAGAPHHEPLSLLVSTPRNLLLAIAASLPHNGSSHESSHE